MGLTGRVLDLSFFPLRDHFEDSKSHIDRVGHQSDA